MQDELSR
jgi:sideroflexin-5